LSPSGEEEEGMGMFEMALERILVKGRERERVDREREGERELESPFFFW